MITTKWGPPGWTFLHKVSFTYSTDLQKEFHEFFYILQFVLPCKYCRASFNQFLHESPITNKVLQNKNNFSHWFYEMHNKVNNKLRNQEKDAVNQYFDQIQQSYKTYHISFNDAIQELRAFIKKTMITNNDPSFISVKAKYDHEDILKDCGEMWLFLGSIIFNYPETLNKKDDEHQSKEKYIKKLFLLLPGVVPYTGYKEKINHFYKQDPIEPNLVCRKTLVQWFHNFYKSVNKQKSVSINHLEKLFESFRSGQCNNKSKKQEKIRIKSCRAN